MSHEITVVIPTIPKRKVMLSRAMRSVMAQTLPARAVIVQADNDKEGSAVTRNRALESVRTPWVAFLDDDDQFLPHHLQRLSRALTETQADVVYPLPRVLDGRGRVIPRQWMWGGPSEFDPELLARQSYINISSVVRTDLAQQVGFKFVRNSEDGGLYDDHGFYLGLYQAGAKFAHVHEETFLWHHHGMNTSGQPNKGDAK